MYTRKSGFKITKETPFLNEGPNRKLRRASERLHNNSGKVAIVVNQIGFDPNRGLGIFIKYKAHLQRFFKRKPILHYIPA